MEGDKEGMNGWKLKEAEGMEGGRVEGEERKG